MQVLHGYCYSPYRVGHFNMSMLGNCPLLECLSGSILLETIPVTCSAILKFEEEPEECAMVIISYSQAQTNSMPSQHFYMI